MYVYINPISFLRLDILFIDCGIFVREYVRMCVCMWNDVGIKENTCMLYVMRVCVYIVFNFSWLFSLLCIQRFESIVVLIDQRKIHSLLVVFRLFSILTLSASVCVWWFDFNFIHSNHIIDTCTLGRFCSMLNIKSHCKNAF